MKTMEQIEAIRTLHASGNSDSSIARDLQIDRKTVNKYVNMDDFNVDVKAFIVVSRGSKLDPYKEEIRKILDDHEAKGPYHKQKFTAKRMHEYLVDELGHSELEDSYQLVQRFMKELREEKRRGAWQAGTSPLVWNPAEAQADFGEADFELEDSSLKRYPYFVVSFPYSNVHISVVMPGENCECVCTALAAVFDFIGGVPSRIVFDNATGIGHRVQNILEENAGFTRFKCHYGFAATFANPYSGWEKGNVENAVGTIRRNLFVPPMKITGQLMDFNRSTLMPKSFNYGFDKPHYSKGTPVCELWEEDRNAMHPLPKKELTVHRIDRMRTSNVGAFAIDGKFTYHLGGDYANLLILVERTAEWTSRSGAPSGASARSP